MRQANTVDISRRSPSYEVRLSKYSFRDFEIYVPDLKREEVDPTVINHSTHLSSMGSDTPIRFSNVPSLVSRALLDLSYWNGSTTLAPAKCT